MGPIRSEQMCSRCRNHGISSILKGHKRVCEFLFCTCMKCNETKMRQKYIASEIAIHRKHHKKSNFINDDPKLKFAFQNYDNMRLSLESATNGEHRRSQMCARCKNHGVDQPLRGHKNDCKFANCDCDVCVITAERRKIMAKQIRDYRQTKLNDDSDVRIEENYDDEFPSSDEEIEVQLPVQTSLEAPRPTTHFFDKFYMVQTLYDKFLLQEPRKQVQLLYALVILSGENCSTLENALQEGKKLLNFFLHT